MRDTDFKNGNHCLPTGSSILTNGKNIIDGYRPDLSIVDSNNNIYLILESESKSDRKAFIGALVKASHFAYHNEKSVTLIFVMKEVKNQTTVAQVSSNIEPYFQWLCGLGSTQLNRVCFISDIAYLKSVNNNETLLSDKFLENCIVLKCNNK